MGLLTVALVGFGIGIVWGIVDILIKEGKEIKAPETLKTELTEKDRDMAKATSEKIKEVVGENPVKEFESMSTSEKISKLEEITAELIELYSLEDVKYEMVNMTNMNLWGYYDDETKTLRINIGMFLLDKNQIKDDKEDEYTMIVVKETLNTIAHELRHAVQHRAIELDNDEYWGIDKETRLKWAYEFANYVSAGVNPRKYSNQEVEKDANTFAEEAMKGVFDNE